MALRASLFQNVARWNKMPGRSLVTGFRRMSSEVDEDEYKAVVDSQSREGCVAWKEEAIKGAVQKGILSEDNNLALFYNLTKYREQFRAVQRAFPGAHFTHTMALKANPVLPLLEIAEAEGVGFEAASHGELFQALRASPDRSRIVFDSPTKTRRELALALKEGVYINLDNFQELDVLVELMETHTGPPPHVGLRINPQVGTGSMSAFSTAGTYSKFGIGYDQLDAVMTAYQKYPFLNGIHVHVGSQGCAVDLCVRGIRRVVDVALEVNSRVGKKQVNFLDIGGGIAVNYANESDAYGDLAVSFDGMADALRATVPELFSGDYQVFTEYGRLYNAKPGFIVSRVEYNKMAADRNIAAVHVGTDMFTRYVWHPHEWKLRVSIMNPDGSLVPASTPRIRQDISGPCCIAGDVVAHRRALPPMSRGQWVLFHDTGAYTYSHFSFYNSRQAPPIYGFEEEDPAGTLRLIKKGVTVEETMAFFS